MAETATPTNGTKSELVKPGPLGQLKRFCEDPETQRRLKEMLGSRAGAFANSIINVVKNSKQLQDIAATNPASIMSSAMIAASVNLPIDPALGFAAIVPYAGKNPAAQFQLMYRGLIQLAIRSGQYAHMHDTVVYRDEIKSYNPITGDVEFTPQDSWQLRYADTPQVEDVAGFYFCFRLKSGFEAAKFLPFKEAMAHGRRFSKSYQADIKYGKATSLWSTDPVSMGAKTCIKMLLSKYGILSIEMQDAFVGESDDFASEIPETVDPNHQIGTEGCKRRLAERIAPTTEGTTDVMDGQFEDAAGGEPQESATEDGADAAEPIEQQPEPTLEQQADELFGPADGPTDKWACGKCKKGFKTRPARGKCPDCGEPVTELNIKF